MALEENKKQAEQILESLNKLSLKDSLQVIANVILGLGIKQTNTNIKISDTYELRKFLVEQKLKHGETIATALIEQGIVMLVWLDSI